jgi:hypothetical protein
MRIRIIALYFCIGLFSIRASANDNIRPGIRFGAFYFDGWTGKTFHISKKLISDFPERKPVNGWITSTQVSVDQQINQAAEAGLSFFNFCWYYNGNSGNDIAANVRNNALNFYLKSPNKSKLDFSLLVANHKGYFIKKEHWPLLIDYWCKLFQDPSYVKVNGAPLITFFDTYSLISTFKNSANVKIAFDQFKKKALALGFPDIRLAICLNNPGEMAVAERCGFDIITTYNNHASAMQVSTGTISLNNQILSNDNQEWTKMLRKTKKAVIPTITLNWDRRPWDTGVKMSKRFSGFSGESVKEAILSSKRWLSTNDNRMDDKIAFVYAWNEYGEGAWLTPSLKWGDQLLKGLADGIAAR